MAKEPTTPTGATVARPLTTNAIGAHIPVTSLTHSGTFDPADWLARYSALCGCYAATDSGLKLCTIVTDQTEAELSRARELIVGLSEVDKAAILDHLNAGPSALQGPDHAIIDAWDRRAAAYARYNALPYSEKEGCAYTPEEQAEWDIIDAAEEVIRAQVAVSPQGVAIQLWTALQHSQLKKDEEAACLHRDLANLTARDSDLDWGERLIVAALRSLKSMEVRS